MQKLKKKIFPLVCVVMKIKQYYIYTSKQTFEKHVDFLLRSVKDFHRYMTNKTKPHDIAPQEYWKTT